MITEVSGNLLRDDAQALVNTVNLVGVMGKGIALQFKRAFPDVFTAYAEACARGELRPGRIFPVRIEGTDRWVLNFPTKRHWRQRSRLDDIVAGLDDLAALLVDLKIQAVAVPPLGCGNGGLQWSVVRPLIFEKLGGLDLDVRVYVPGTPHPQDMVTGVERPPLTLDRSRLISALSRYVTLAFESGVSMMPRLSLLEAHKVPYLVQCAGLDLGLRFTPHLYGPFSPGLNRELAAMEGHYLLGYGDGTLGARAVMEIQPEAAAAAESAVADDVAFQQAWEVVRRAVVGYEYPEGMELLASVQFLAMKSAEATDPGALVREMAAWSPRKQRIFTPGDIGGAFTRLHEAGLLVSR
ncbi:type II toxin-antitoxin system antitoxin DNA ADP-ribosyl glycohydrolase DarG [Nonomuraea candida]|uniref:type II toxin-antitoxin system antitoxin DNA ADP-ribosyl glycohydrolase DarG n=1 Tax=Nonomuraea candida TaxID=359159 RepID=UPI0005BA8139|nr:macro domain-containing protein [Nonomuraea candida]